MKTNASLCFAAGLTAALVGFGCAAAPPPADPPPQPPAPVVTATPETPPPPAPAAEPSFVGLPLTGSQIDVLGNIEFDTDSATIRQTPQTIGILTTLASAGKLYPQITKLRVEGHTDSDGNEAHNLDLSQRRALSVVKWLTDHDIAPNRLTAAGCGARDPLAPNTSPENKQKNRRTEFDIEEAGGKPFSLATVACAPNPARMKQ